MIGGISISTDAKIHARRLIVRRSHRYMNGEDMESEREKVRTKSDECLHQRLVQDVDATCAQPLIPERVYAQDVPRLGIFRREKKSRVKAMCPQGMCTIGIHVG
jgi:hypothetical protein